MRDLDIVPPSLFFVWKKKPYAITSCGIKNYVPYSTVEPHNQDLVDELEKRIGKEKALSLYMAHGYVCFEDEYRKMEAEWQQP